MQCIVYWGPQGPGSGGTQPPSAGTVWLYHWKRARSGSANEVHKIYKTQFFSNKNSAIPFH